MCDPIAFVRSFVRHRFFGRHSLRARPLVASQRVRRFRLPLPFPSLHRLRLADAARSFSLPFISPGLPATFVAQLRLLPTWSFSLHLLRSLWHSHGSTIDMFVKVDGYINPAKVRSTPRILLLCCAVARRHALSLRCFRCRSLCGCGMCHHACTRAGGQGCLHHRRTPCRIQQWNVPRPNRGTNVGCVVVSVPTPFSCAVCWFVGFMAVLSAMARQCRAVPCWGCAVRCQLEVRLTHLSFCPAEPLVAAAGATIRPVVLMHGLGDAGSNPGMQSLAKSVMAKCVRHAAG